MSDADESGMLAGLCRHRDRLLAEAARAADLYMRSPAFLWGLRYSIDTMNDLRRMLDRLFPGSLGVDLG
jgi:hypothetical protein